MKNRKWAAICLCVAAMSLSGCAETIELTDEEQNIIAEYAASALLNYDNGYNARFEEDAILEAKAEAKERQENRTAQPVPVETQEPETEEPVPTIEPVMVTPTPEPVVETPVPTEEPTPVPETESTPATMKQNRLSPYEMGKLFGMEGVEVNYTGFQALDTYPVMASGELGFTMQANQGAKLIAVTFTLTNRLDEPKSCNIVGQNIKFQLRFNDSDNVAVQKTLLTDDFASMNCMLQPGESRQAVIVCQVASGYEASISSVDLITRIGGENTTMNLQ